MKSQKSVFDRLSFDTISFNPWSFNPKSFDPGLFMSVNPESYFKRLFLKEM